jgi:GxxExxY protein
MEQLITRIIKASYNVHNILGAGYLEKVYRNSLLIELNSMGIKADFEVPISVYYKKCIVGEFYADILVEDSIVLELKAVENIQPFHEVQLVNYLKSTDIETGLLINFGRSVTIKRKFKECLICKSCLT